jgi:predicted ATP-dependent protease
MKKKTPLESPSLDEITTTSNVKIPEDVLDQVIGQPHAVKKVKLEKTAVKVCIMHRLRYHRNNVFIT